jgi:hypothetical protein
MIRTVSDFLEALMAKERENLPNYDEIQHPGLFGEIYEGLAKALIERALFDGMDLRIAGGKIRNSKGNLSGQIDCMVVLGPGEPIPFTQHFIYPVDKVVMIIEVKKTLYGANLKEAMELFRHFWREIAEAGPLQTGLINDAWRALFKKNLPAATEVDAMPFHEQLIYHSLLVEAGLPLRVVFGYDGYVDEYGLREGLVGYLEEVSGLPLVERPRFNINTFPNLIVCRKASLIKLDGMPYSGMIDGRGYWWWMGSRRSEPFHSLLELLWTRLTYIFKLGPEIFGEDLEMEAVNPLLAAKAEPLGERGGWRYESMPLSRKDLEGGADRDEWHPPTLNKAEFVIINALRSKGSIDLTEQALVAFLKKEGETVESISKSLNQKMLTAVVGQKLTFIVDQCDCIMLPDGRCVAAENKSGRLSRYAMKVMEEVRRRRAKETPKDAAPKAGSGIASVSNELPAKIPASDSLPDCK